MVWREVTLRLSGMTGNQGKCLRQVAALAAEKKINVTFRIDDARLHVTFDPADLPDHPERRRPVKSVPGRVVGIDLNPCWIGLAAIESVDRMRLKDTKLLDWKLIKLDHDSDGPMEVAREAMAATADQAIRLARQVGAGTIAVEKGLGKLRSSGKNRKLNQILNHWGRTVFVQMLRRKAGLAGITVIEVWGGYSTTIGNSAFQAPDACASAGEIARRALSLLAGSKDVLPAFTREVRSGLWKDLNVPKQLRKELRRAKTWGEVHRAVKAAKDFGYRRPHPAMPDPGGRHPGGHAVRRLGRHRQPGLIARPLGSDRPSQINPKKRELQTRFTHIG